MRSGLGVLHIEFVWSIVHVDAISVHDFLQASYDYPTTLFRSTVIDLSVYLCAQPALVSGSQVDPSPSFNVQTSFLLPPHNA